MFIILWWRDLLSGAGWFAVVLVGITVVLLFFGFWLLPVLVPGVAVYAGIYRAGRRFFESGCLGRLVLEVFTFAYMIGWCGFGGGFYIWFVLVPLFRAFGWFNLE